MSNQIRHIALATLLLLLALAPPASAGEKTLVFSEIADSSSGPVAQAVLRHAYARLGYTIASSPLPGGRALHDSVAGVTDGELVRVAALEKSYPTLVRVDPHIMAMDSVAFAKGAPIPVSGPESLRPYRIGIPLGIAYLEQMFDKKTYNVVAMPESYKLFEMLEKGRVDVVVMVRLAGLRRIQQMGYDDIRAMQPPLVRINLHHYLNERHAALVPKIGAVLADMRKTGEIARITRQVLAKTHPGIDVVAD